MGDDAQAGLECCADVPCSVSKVHDLYASRAFARAPAIEATQNLYYLTACVQLCIFVICVCVCVCV